MTSFSFVIIAIVVLMQHVSYSFFLNSIDQSRCHHLRSSSDSPVAPFTLQSSNEPLQDLEIVDIEEGTGAIAKFESIVTIKYTGRFYESGEDFDQSMISFKLGFGKVLDGCDKGIRDMKVGGTRLLKIPSRLGFGTEGFGPEPYSIPPNSDLEYTVELTAVASGPMAEAAANMGIGLDPNTIYLK